MKKYFTFFLLSFVFSNIFLFSQFGGGTGNTIYDPYEIWEKNHIGELSDSLFGSTLWSANKHFKLMRDVKDSLTSSITIYYFYGYFHGNKKKIFLAIDVDSLFNNFTSSNALFPNVSNAGNIDNLDLDGYITSVMYAGGIVVANDTEITQCINNATIISTNTTVIYGSSVGAIAAISYGTISHCINNGNVSGLDFVAGIATQNLGVITNCINTGKIKGTELSNTGYIGVAGITTELYSGRYILNCINLGDVEGINSVSGIVGNAYEAINPPQTEIANCINAGFIKGKKDVSGILGYQGGTEVIIRNCINTGIIEGEENVGSIVGKE